LAALALVGACSNIIGISSYEIDPKLNEGSGGTSSSGGKLGSGGKTPLIEGGAPAGGDNSGIAGKNGGKGGKASGGTPSTGGAGDAGSPMGGDGTAGDGVGGATEPTGCTGSKDCDDTIDCTTDTCLANGKCGHAPKDTRCDSTRCETCTVGVGCVAGSSTQTQILLDPNFDAGTGDWVDVNSNIVTNALPQSPTKIANFGPAPANATKHIYYDLLQYVTLPAGVAGLTVTGYYKLTPFAKAHTTDPGDYVVLQVYDLNGSAAAAVEFNSFSATLGAKTEWGQKFTYAASPSELALLTDGGDYTFDFVGHVFSTFQFDTMTLTATTCQ
jgi:hypothetical protein